MTNYEPKSAPRRADDRSEEKSLLFEVPLQNCCLFPRYPLSWTLPSGDDAQAASWFLAVANVLQSREDCWLAAAIPGLFMIATACLKSPRRLFGSA
jgi:hypothetical protein